MVSMKSLLRVLSFGSLLILVSPACHARGMDWTVYKDKDARFETAYPSQLVVSTSTSGDDRVVTFKYQGKEPDWNYLDLWVVSKACSSAPDCVEIDLTLALDRNAKVDDTRMCRTLLTDHAMGGMWASHIVYSGFRDGICYKIGYDGHKGFDLDKNGTGRRLKSEEELNPKKDPYVLSEMIRRFKFDGPNKKNQ